MHDSKTIITQVRALLKPYPGASLRKEFGRLYVDLGTFPYRADRSPETGFGVMSISPVKVTPSVLEDIVETAVAFMDERENEFKEGTTFKVNTRRVWKEYPHSSHEMNHMVGSPILRKFQQLRVDVRNPDIELRVEIRDQGTYIFNEVIPAVGGFLSVLTAKRWRCCREELIVLWRHGLP